MSEKGPKMGRKARETVRDTRKYRYTGAKKDDGRAAIQEYVPVAANTEAQDSKVRELAELIQLRGTAGGKVLLGDNNTPLFKAPGDFSTYYEAIQGLKEKEVTARWADALEQYVFDLNDPYQRQLANEILPEIKDKRRNFIEKSVNQYAFIQTMQFLDIFRKKEDVYRMIMILGGKEALICLSQWMGIMNIGGKVGTLADTFFNISNDYKVIFPLDDNELYYEDACKDSDLQKVLIGIAQSVLHLFPALLKGKTGPYGKVGIYDGKADGAAAAKELQRICCGIVSDMPSYDYAGTLVSGFVGKKMEGLASTKPTSGLPANTGRTLAAAGVF
jgi:hypothetical protein